MRKRAARHENSTKKSDVLETVRDQVNAARENLSYPDQKTVISDGVNLLCNYKSEKAALMETNMFFGDKKFFIELLEGQPCRRCCAPITVKSTANLGVAISLVVVCKNGHEMEWNSSEPNKECTHCTADFDLCAATIMAKSTAARLRDTLEVAGFQKMSSTVFNSAQNELNELAEKYLTFDKALTESKIKQAYGVMAPEFEIDTAFHTRINSWTAVTTALCARTKLVAESVMEVTGEGICSQQLEKRGMGKVLPAVIERYDSCSSVTTDACGSLRKQVADIVKPMVEKGECEQLLDIWHQQKGIYSKYCAFIDSKWGVLPPRHGEDGKRIPNSMADIQENALQKKEMKRLARWMRGHFTYTVDHAQQDKETATKIWKNAAAHLAGDHSKCLEYNDEADCSTSTIRLRTPKMVEVMTKFLEQKGLIDDFESYRNDRSTSFIESFNNTLAAFADKRLFFNLKALRLRHVLAILSWNEMRGRDLVGRKEAKVGPRNSRHPNRHARNRYVEPVHAWRVNLMRNFQDARPIQK